MLDLPGEGYEIRNNYAFINAFTGIIQGAKDGKGRGRQVIAVAKTCHLIFIVLDVLKPLTDKKIIETELEGFGIRINKSPPNIVFKKKERGGINITSTAPLTNLDNEVCQSTIYGGLGPNSGR